MNGVILRIVLGWMLGGFGGWASEVYVRAPSKWKLFSGKIDISYRLPSKIGAFSIDLYQDGGDDKIISKLLPISNPKLGIVSFDCDILLPPGAYRFNLQKIVWTAARNHSLAWSNPMTVEWLDSVSFKWKHKAAASELQWQRQLRLVLKSSSRVSCNPRRGNWSAVGISLRLVYRNHPVATREFVINEQRLDAEMVLEKSCYKHFSWGCEAIKNFGVYQAKLVLEWKGTAYVLAESPDFRVQANESIYKIKVTNLWNCDDVSLEPRDFAHVRLTLPACRGNYDGVKLYKLSFQYDRVSGHRLPKLDYVMERKLPAPPPATSPTSAFGIISDLMLPFRCAELSLAPPTAHDPSRRPLSSVHAQPHSPGAYCFVYVSRSALNDSANRSVLITHELARVFDCIAWRKELIKEVNKLMLGPAKGIWSSWSEWSRCEMENDCIRKRKRLLKYQRRFRDCVMLNSTVEEDVFCKGRAVEVRKCRDECEDSQSSNSTDIIIFPKLKSSKHSLLRSPHVRNFRSHRTSIIQRHHQSQLQQLWPIREPGIFFRYLLAPFLALCVLCFIIIISVCGPKNRQLSASTSATDEGENVVMSDRDRFDATKLHNVASSEFRKRRVISPVVKEDVIDEEDTPDLEYDELMTNEPGSFFQPEAIVGWPTPPMMLKSMIRK